MVLYVHSFVRVCYCDVESKIKVESLVGGCVVELGKKRICDAEIGLFWIEDDIAFYI